MGDHAPKLEIPGFGTPVVLRPGEALAAEYRVDAPVGALALRVSGPSGHILPAAYTYVSGERSGRVLFVASESGMHGYEADATSIKGNSVCGEGSVPEYAAPPAECPTLDVDYSVSWRWLRADEVVRSSWPRATVPPAGGESTHQEL